MKAYEEVRSHLQPGAVYRRADLLPWSNAVDRHLDELVKHKVLRKLSGGLYHYPKQTSFGDAPPTDTDLVRAFLKDDRFLMFNPSSYNSLNLGTTQLYNETLVYNHKRHGVLTLGNRTYRFVLKHFFPLKLSEEFLFVDLLNNVTKLAEDTDNVLQKAKEKVAVMDSGKLQRNTLDYGSVRAKKFVKSALEGRMN